MSREREAAHCRCGTRLARDNRSRLCESCGRRQATRLAAPPSLPTDFWYAVGLQDAFAQRHMGKVIRAYRHHPFHGQHPLPQDLVAGWMGQTQAQLSRLENGPGPRDIDRLIAWATLLAMPGEMLWFALPRPSCSPTDAHEVPRVRGPGAPLAFLEALRVADRQVGGAHLYASVLTRLPGAADSPPRLRRGADAAAGAVLGEMAAWMALDAGADRRAQRHLREAVATVRSSGDGHLTAQIGASQSHHTRHTGDATAALTQARTGLATLRTAPPHGPLRARLLAMQACALAVSGMPVEAAHSIAEAERAFTYACTEPSPWLSPFDSAALTMETARCLIHIGDLPQAEQRLRAVLTYRRAERVRSRALAHLMLVTVLVSQGRLDEACGVVGETIDRTTGLGSAVVVGHLRHAALLLGSHADRSHVVPPLLERLRNAVASRAWIGIAAGSREI